MFAGMDTHTWSQLGLSAVSFLAGVGSTVMWARAKGYTIEAKKHHSCGP